MPRFVLCICGGGGVFVALIRLRFSDIRLQMGYVRSRMAEKGINLKN